MEILVRKAENCEHLLGKWLDESHFDRVITSDCDLYKETFDGVNNEDNIIFKFRKQVFSQEEQRGAYEGLIGAARETQNRGTAAGQRGETLGNRDYVTALQYEILDAIMDAPESTLIEYDAIDEAIRKHDPNKSVNRGQVWLREKIKKAGKEYHTFFNEWVESIRPLSVKERKIEAVKIAKDFISDTTYANTVFSGLAGYFDRYPRIPYGRATSYTEQHPELFAKSYPYLQTLSRYFEELLPERYGRQKAFTDKIDERFVVPGTPYTTITVNKTFRTAAHRDAGDLSEGFSNITCVSHDGVKHWGGCLFVLPEFKIAVELHPGDLLLVNNHEGMHGNTQITGENVERISIVAYAREKMAELGSWEYEKLRRQFVDDRRRDETHKLQRPLWNGVSPGMWDSQEWFDYLERHGGVAMREQYHPKKKERPTLDGLF